MKARRAKRTCALGLAACFTLLAWPQLAGAHGGVVEEEDTCLLRMGFLQAHFTLYQPELRGAEQFCEEVPEVGSSLFVIEYLHEMMKQIPVDFRIIRDDQGFGIFANWEDVQSIADLDAQTVLHRTLAPEPTGWLTLRHNFQEAGGYIGVIVAQNPANQKNYTSVFYFEVGNAGYGLIPLFAVLVLAAQLTFWLSTGSLQRIIGGIRMRR